MGGFFSRFRKKQKDMRILMIGLDNAGKTTILYKLKLGEVITSIPTIGFNVESVKYKHITFTVWDIGGQEKIRPLWRHYYQNAHGIIFVIDSNDKERIDDKHGNDNNAEYELKKLLLEHELRNSALLVLANKQDMKHSLPVHEITERLGLQKLRNRHWNIQGTCATTGEGLYEGLDWLSSTLSKINKQRKKKQRKY
mmetsp:Transcript_91774/g.112398  ORF Transcript_91774/g.112398 Transcript_91774/m.112398 type:complete len:196 (-) Transcript_91774:38-625(-)